MASLGQHNVVATFKEPEAARRAVTALGRAGVEADKISFLGRDVDEVTSDPDTRLRDLEVTGAVAKKAGLGGAVGSTLGALAGAAAFAIPGVGPVIGAGIWGAAAAGAAAGGAVGGMVGGVASIDLSEDWELTFGEALREGQVLVAVQADDEDGMAKARKVLEGEGPERVERIDSEGKLAPAS